MSQLALSQATVGSCCYILGAGFSCGAGLPLSNDFLDKMKAVRPQYYLGKTLPPLNVPMENLFRFRSERLKLFDDSLKNNVEFWLSLVSAGTLGSITSRGFTKYHMQIAIAQVIEYYVRSATNYEYIDKFVFYANKSKNNAIVTLNYDDLVEQSCERSMVPYRHGFKKGGYNGYFDLDISSFNKEMFDIDENHATIPILKLHGSYNWIAKNYETLKLVGDMHNFFFSNHGVLGK
ncbi:SIR2 family protein [Acidithiobacillus sp. M4-SHS-6]|uniref:SIR2 family protein n=1 Tax=Acidithiobacillus sp. M4-SHS-6 TaxID=3383024 RepID=UPI0039BE787C